MTKCFDAQEPNGWEVRLEGETEIELSATLISEQYGSITQSNKKKLNFCSIMQVLIMFKYQSCSFWQKYSSKYKYKGIKIIFLLPNTLKVTRRRRRGSQKEDTFEIPRESSKQRCIYEKIVQACVVMAREKVSCQCCSICVKLALGILLKM